MSWDTVAESQEGIERFLLDGPKTLHQTCWYAQQTGGIAFIATTGLVRGLMEAGRIELFTPKGSPTKSTQPLTRLQLSSWNEKSLRGETA